MYIMSDVNTFPIVTSSLGRKLKRYSV